MANNVSSMKTKVESALEEVKAGLTAIEQFDGMIMTQNIAPLAKKRIMIATAWLGSKAHFNQLVGEYKDVMEAEQPHKNFIRMLPLEDLLVEVNRIGAEIVNDADNPSATESALKVAEEQFTQDHYTLLKTFLKELTDTKAALAKANNLGEKKRQKAQEDEEKAKRAVEEDERKKSTLAEPVASRSGAEQKLPRSQAIRLWHLDAKALGHPHIPAGTSLSDIATALGQPQFAGASLSEIPYIVRFNLHNHIKDKPSLTGTVAVFSGSYKRSKVLQAKGKVSTTIGASEKETDLHGAMIAACAPDMKRDELDTELKQTTFFGYSGTYKSEGRTEPQFLPCVRCLLEGKRLMWCCSFSDAKAAFSEWHPRKVATVAEVVTFMFAADRDLLDWMAKNQKYIYHRVQTTATALYLPAGWLLWERTTNEGCCGVRWTGYIDNEKNWSEIKAIRNMGAKDTNDATQTKTVEYVETFLAANMPDGTGVLVVKTPKDTDGAPGLATPLMVSPMRGKRNVGGVTMASMAMSPSKKQTLGSQAMLYERVCAIVFFI